MALSSDVASDTVKDLLKHNEAEQRRLELVSNYVHGKHESLYVPEGARDEYKWLLDRSTYNLVKLAVSVIAQNLYVDGYRDGDDDSAAWDIWQANRFDLFQHGVHRSALTYGYSYVVSLPGRRMIGGESQKMPALRPVSPRNMVAVYEDPVLDEWPIYAVEVTHGLTTRGPVRKVALYDENMIYRFEGPDEKLEFQSSDAHDTGFCPVVKYRNIIDLDDCNEGEVEPLMKLQDQVNFTTFGLMMAQEYAAFPQRYVTGLVDDSPEGGEQPFRPRIDAILATASADAKFGQFAAADLQGYLKSREETLRGMSIIAQLPPYQFLGTDDLASAEALAAARDGLDRVVNERESNFGESHEQLMRVASKQKGDTAGWEDTSSQVVWRDTSTRAFAATVDALTKLGQGLQVPFQALWEKIPGVTKQDVERWAKMAEEQPDAVREIIGRLESQNAVVASTSGNADGDNADPALQQ